MDDLELPMSSEHAGAGLQVPKWAMVAISFCGGLLMLGATGGIKAYTLDERVRADSTILARHLLWAEQRDDVLTALGPTVGRVDAKVDALTRLKCLEARDLPHPNERRQAIDRLVLSQIDCGDLLGNKVPVQ